MLTNNPDIITHTKPCKVNSSVISVRSLTHCVAVIRYRAALGKSSTKAGAITSGSQCSIFWDFSEMSKFNCMFMIEVIFKGAAVRPYAEKCF